MRLLKIFIWSIANLLFCIEVLATSEQNAANSNPSQPKPSIPKIALIVDQPQLNYQSILKGMRDYSRQHMGRVISFKLVNIQNLGDAEIVEQLADGYQIAITAGVSATKSVLRQMPELPVFALMVEQPELDALYKKYSKQPRTMSGIYRSQPFYRFAALVKKLLPQAKTAGILLSQKSKTLKPEYDKIMNDHGLRPIVNIVRSNDLPQRVLEQLVKKSDVLITLFDDKLYTPDNIKSHLLTAFRHQVPVIGVSRNYTELGALVSLHTENYEIGKQAAKQMIALLDNPGLNIKPAYPESFAVKINPYVMESSGIRQASESDVFRAVQKADRKYR